MSTEDSPSEATGMIFVPNEEVQPEERSTLSVHYMNGQPALVFTGGVCIPTKLPIIDSSGQQVGAFGLLVPTDNLSPQVQADILNGINAKFVPVRILSSSRERFPTSR
ncbi:hypothetical protein [Streptomyces sp. YIM 121038]|uniref:hypothetical protein n=1 Tax=Streptomyces sp. YIM 121038 TaxID=2136401 RepID=UPI0011103879|nr:hypothetical protein [Streptomyces sp. YIM 121038]